MTNYFVVVPFLGFTQQPHTKTHVLLVWAAGSTRRRSMRWWRTATMEPAKRSPESRDSDCAPVRRDRRCNRWWMRLRDLVRLHRLRWLDRCDSTLTGDCCDCSSATCEMCSLVRGQWRGEFVRRSDEDGQMDLQSRYTHITSTRHTVDVRYTDQIAGMFASRFTARN